MAENDPELPPTSRMEGRRTQDLEEALSIEREERKKLQTRVDALEQKKPEKQNDPDLFDLDLMPFGE